MSLGGKVVVVTGASMGIGEAIVRRFLREGASVVLCSRDLGRVEAARQRCGALDRTLALACDVTKRAEIDRLIAATLAHFGRVDIWVNNAGFGLVDSVEHMEMAAARAMFDTNLFGAIECMQAITPHFKAQRSGAIVNLSSMAGLIAVPYMAAYGATKHALNCIGRAAREELASHGVQVNTVCPGYVQTDFNVHAVRGKESLRVAGSRNYGVSAERVAEATYIAWQQNRAQIVVPWSGNLVVAIYRLLPGFFYWGMKKMMKRMEKS
jgi:short-subunit dehydrogenase